MGILSQKSTSYSLNLLNRPKIKSDSIVSIFAIIWGYCQVTECCLIVFFGPSKSRNDYFSCISKKVWYLLSYYELLRLLMFLLKSWTFHSSITLELNMLLIYFLSDISVQRGILKECPVKSYSNIFPCLVCTN